MDKGDTVAGLSVRVGNLEQKLDSQGQKLDQVLTFMAEQRAQQPTGWDKILSVVKDGLVLLGLIVSGIIYVASNHNAGSISVMAYRLEQLAKVVDGAPPSPWRVEVRR